MELLTGGWVDVAVKAAAIASAVMGGVFFAFSAFIMRALGNIPSAEGIKAMQRINIDVFCWSFSLLFFTLPIALTGLAIIALQNMSTPHAAELITAAILYVCGAFLVTVFGNVPLNNALAKVNADTDKGTGIWIDFQHRWIRWNHVRTVACLAAATVLAFA